MVSSAPPRPPAIPIVEDEPLPMMDAVEIVADAGFRTCEATNAARAIEIVETRDDILLVSSGRAVAREEDMPAASLFLPRPCRAEQVHRMLDRLLKAARVSPARRTEASAS